VQQGTSFFWLGVTFLFFLCGVRPCQNIVLGRELCTSDGCLGLFPGGARPGGRFLFQKNITGAETPPLAGGVSFRLGRRPWPHFCLSVFCLPLFWSRLETCSPGPLLPFISHFNVSYGIHALFPLWYRLMAVTGWFRRPLAGGLFFCGKVPPHGGLWKRTEDR